MREKLIDIVEYCADFLDWDTKEELVDSIIEAFATDNNVGSKWISVTERLPDTYHRVFMAGRNGGVFIGERIFGTTAVSDGHSRGFTHWMELPEAPKEDQHGTRSI